MKRLARALFGPILRPLLRRLHARVVHWVREDTGERFANLETQLAACQADLQGIERYVPALLGAIANQNAMNRANVRSEAELARLVRSVFDQFHAVREELAGIAANRLDGALEPKVLRPERLAGDRLKVVVGSDRTQDPDVVRVGPVATDSTDVVASPANLPFEPGTVVELEVGEPLERFSLRELTDLLLPHWVNVLAPRGSLTVRARDADALVRAYVAGTVDFDELRAEALGDGAGGRTRTLFDRATLACLLEEAGLDEVTVRAEAAPPDRRIEATGRKPAGTEH